MRLRNGMLVVLAVLLVAGPACSRQAEETGKGTAEKGAADAGLPEQAGEAGQGQPAGGADLTAVLAAAARYLPPDLLVVGAVDLAAGAQALSGSLGAGHMQAPEMKAAQEELARYFLARLGFDPMRARAAVVFVSQSALFGMLAQGDFGFRDAGPARGEELGGMQALRVMDAPEVWVIPLPGFGLAAAFRRGPTEKLAAFLKGRESGVPAVLPDALAGGLRLQPRAWLAVAVDLTPSLVAMNWDREIPFPRPDLVAFHVTADRMALAVKGSEECLDGLMKLVGEGKAAAKAWLARAKAEVDEMGVAEGAGIILADHLVDLAFSQYTPVRTRGRLEMQLELEQWMGFQLLGTVAAVAVPAFLKYERRARTIDVTPEIDKVYREAQQHFGEPPGPVKAESVPPGPEKVQGSGADEPAAQ